jgi:azurin
MSSATQTIVKKRMSAAFPVLIATLAFVVATVTVFAWRWNDSETRGAISIPVLELGTQGDSMVFDRAELKARAGTMVKVVFRNNSRLVAMAHNWVLVQPGAEQSSAAAGIAAGEKQNFRAPNDPNMIASTKLTPPGESSSVTFVAPPPGNYPYFCAFPGHQMVMKGTLHTMP